ncbi:MAG: hypothetical protein ABI120_15205 [Gemmatimonadaceae bacterium]
MFLRRLVTSVVLTFIAASCRWDTDGLPHKWGPLARAATDRCPNVAGRYFDTSAPISWMLAGRYVPRDRGTADLEYFELFGSADTALVATAVTRDSVTYTAHLTKGSPYTGDYFCEDGWLQLSNSSIPNLWDADITASQFFPRRHAFRVAPGANKALVARLDFIDFEEFTVWCGDGCKGFPLPWTFETHSTWSRARAWNADGVSSYEDGVEQQGTQLPAFMNDRLAREEQALENGTTGSQPTNMKGFVRHKR